MPIRYFLSSTPDKNYLDFVRDLRQDLSKYKSTIEFKNLPDIFIHHKFLGQDFSELVVKDIWKGIQSELEDKVEQKFQLQLGKLSLGHRYKQQKQLLLQDIKITSEFKLLTRYLHTWAVNASEYVVPKKEPVSVLGKIKLANLDQNTSKNDFKNIQKIVDNCEAPKSSIVDNFKMVQSYLYKSKPKYDLKFDYQI